MNALRRLQQDFQGYLLQCDARMQGQVAGTARVSAEVRLGIYADAYRLRLLEALTTDYIALRAMLGDDEFDDLGRAYIDAHPSRHFSIRWFGRHLAQFLRTTAPYADHPLLAEMAAFEWAMTDAFDAADTAPVDVADIAAIPAADWPQLRFTLHPSAQRLDLAWNVPTLWKALTKDEAPPEPTRGDFPVAWKIWRQGLKTYFRSLGVDEAWAFDAMRAGEDFAAVCAGLTEWIDATHVAQHAAGLLKQWVTDGLIVGFGPGKP